MKKNNRDVKLNWIIKRKLNHFRNNKNNHSEKYVMYKYNSCGLFLPKKVLFLVGGGSNCPLPHPACAPMAPGILNVAAGGKKL